jgi:hypothetical protein
MLYRPKYCCECGEEIHRENWGLFTSRRLCEYCESQSGASELIRKAMVPVALVSILLGVGSWFKNSGKTITVSRASNNTARSLADVSGVSGTKEQKPAQVLGTRDLDGVSADEQQTPDPTLAKQGSSDVPGQEFAKRSPNMVAEPMYTCGARTRKGSPCSRKVKGDERCWQHTGLPKMTEVDQANSK